MRALFKSHGGRLYSSATDDSSVLTSLTYPNGKVVTYNYGYLSGHGVRVVGVQETPALRYDFEYLGYDTLVDTRYWQNMLRATLLQFPGEPLGDAGDKVIGLDRFGRIARLSWRQGTEDQYIRDRFRYGYDRNGNVLFEENLKKDTFSELFQADPAIKSSASTALAASPA